MNWRPSLLLLTCAAAAIAAVANGVDAASPHAEPDAPRSRLGVQISQDLSTADKAATQRDRALDLREQAARATESRLQADLEGSRQGAPAGAGSAAAKPGEGDERYADLARIYQAMKPASAGIVFEQLEMDVQMKVAQHMRERSVALVLAAMTPKGAAALSMALARNQAPPRAQATPQPIAARRATH